MRSQEVPSTLSSPKPLAQAGSPRTMSSQVGVLPWTETPQLLSAACASVQPASLEKSVFLCSKGIPHFSVWAHCLLSWHWDLLRRAWLQLLQPLIRHLYTLSLCKPLQAEQPPLSTSPTTDASVPYPSWWLHQTHSSKSISVLSLGAQQGVQRSRCGLTSMEQRKDLPSASWQGFPWCSPGYHWASLL